MKSRPRIGIHIPGTGAGGPWRCVHSLLKFINCNNYDVRLICDIVGEYQPRPEITVVNFNAHPLNVAVNIVSAASPQARRRLSGLKFTQPRVVLGFYRDARRMARQLKTLNLDLFHTQNTGCEEAPYAAKLAGISSIVGTFHTDWTTDLHNARGGIGYRWLERISNHSLDRAIAVSTATGDNWRRRTGLPPCRIRVVPNGIHADAFARRRSTADARRVWNIPHDAFVLVGLGRMDEVKGFEILLRAVAKARSGVPRIHVLLAGDGPLRQPLEFLAFQLGIADAVTIAGFTSDVTAVLDAADAFALPSLTEACPYAVLEAMAAGLPVLASRVGGVPEIVRHGVTGWLVPPRDPAAWAEAIVRLALDTDRARQFGDAGRQRVLQHYTEAEMARRTFEIYEELLGRSRP